MGLKNMLDAGAAISRMKLNQWKSRAELESIQEQKLRNLISAACGNVPRFRRLPASFRIRSLEDLPNMPIMGKDEIQRNPQSFLHRGCPMQSLQKMQTGGSTGIPMQIFFSAREGIYGSALRYHVLTECGFGPLDRLAVLTHSRFATMPLQRFFYRLSPVPASERPERMLAAIRAMRPGMLFAYPSMLSILAGLNQESRRPIRFPKAVSSSETLTPAARAIISESFGCSIRNYYGSNESWALAWECERGSMHLNSDSVIMEVVGPDGRPVRDGEKGEVLITSLWRHAMPFIRYRLGDIASMGGKCACGRGLHIIRSLEGRAAHMIILPSGRAFAYSQIAIRLGSLGGLLRYQIIQEEAGRLRILAIPSRKKPCSASAIKALFDSALPEKLETEVEFVEGTTPGTSGKTHEFISRVRRPGNG